MIARIFVVLSEICFMLDFKVRVKSSSLNAETINDAEYRDSCLNYK